MSKTLYIIDGHAQIFRSYYARVPPLTSPSGEPTKATMVFCQSLLNLIRDRKPDYLAMVLDTGAETLERTELYPDYKANREPPPEDFGPQCDRIISVVQEMGIPTFSDPRFEADDLMATIAERFKDEDVHIYLVSRDKDLDQLLTDRVSLFDPMKNEEITPESLLESKGWTPETAVEIQTLTGDNTDNIPGVKGVGDKTAAKLIAKFGSAAAVIENADQLTPKQRENVLAFADKIDLTRQLVTLKKDVEFDFDLDACSIEKLTPENVEQTFLELGFTRLVDRLAELTGKPAAESGEETPTPKLASDTPQEYNAVDTPEKLDAFIAELKQQNVFAFDSETTSLNQVAAKLVGLSFSWQEGVAYYIPVRASMGEKLPEEQVLEALRPIFADESTTKIAHNLKYDWGVLNQHSVVINGPLFDTMIASALLDPDRRSHSLDAVTLELFQHTKIPTSDIIGKGKNQVTMDQVPADQTCEYACEDADFTWRIYQELSPRIQEGQIADLFRDTEMPLVRALMEMEANGVAIDVDHLRSHGNELADRMEVLVKDIQGHAGYAFNVDSPKQLSVVLFDEQGLEPVKKTKTGRSTDAETLETLSEIYDNPIPPLVLEYRELAKLKGTYVDPLPSMIVEKTGRIHASFHQTGTITGRLSSSDPNLQNIPVRSEEGQRVRKAFVAGDPDNVLIVADYSQVELRMLAHFCQDSALLEAFRSGQDIHTFVAAQVNGVTPEEVTKDMRSRAKAVNFGIVYGQTAFGLSRSLGIPRGEAQAFIDMYFMRYPGIRMFIDKTILTAKKQGYVETMLGRRRYIPQLQSRNKQQIALGERVAVNTVVQGSAAELIKIAMLAIADDLRTGEHPSKMLLQVHDELVFETPRVSVEQEAEFIRDRMEHAMDLEVPIVADVAWGDNWLEAK